MYEGKRAQSPFDGSAGDRLRRMGLADANGNPEDVRELISGLSESAEDAAEKQKFLLVCLQYDAIYRSLPDPVWWISGNPIAAELFAEGFITHLKQLNQDK